MPIAGPRRTSVSLLLVVFPNAVAVAAEAPDVESRLLAQGHLVCGRDLHLQLDVGELPAAGLELRPRSTERRTATILLEAGPGLQARPEALAAWNRAVAIWEAALHDPVTLTIQGDFGNLGPNVLGGTSSRAFQADFDVIRNQVVADAAASENVVARLPTGADVTVVVPPGFTYGGQLVATKAGLRALGFDMSFDDPVADATITFSTGFESSFDFDPGDGIDSGKLDFEAIVVHEIGHALGFTSEVDDADLLRAQDKTATLRPGLLDLFRLRPGQGATDFTAAGRVVTTGDLAPAQVFFDGSQELALSTGVYLGDGRQASHWKADELTGVSLGIMDPTLEKGVRKELGANDVLALGLIGWDVTGSATVDCNANQIDDDLEIARGTALDCNRNGVPDDCDVENGTSLDADMDGVPDECTLTAVFGTPSARVTVAAHPNPFNPRTVIRFELPRAGRVSLTLYDVRGREVALLARADYPSGRHEIAWDGRDAEDAAVASGVYYLVLHADGRRTRTKLTVLK